MKSSLQRVPRRVHRRRRRPLRRRPMLHLRSGPRLRPARRLGPQSRPRRRRQPQLRHSVPRRQQRHLRTRSPRRRVRPRLQPRSLPGRPLRLQLRRPRSLGGRNERCLAGALRDGRFPASDLLDNPLQANGLLREPHPSRTAPERRRLLRHKPRQRHLPRLRRESNAPAPSRRRNSLPRRYNPMPPDRPLPCREHQRLSRRERLRLQPPEFLESSRPDGRPELLVPPEAHRSCIVRHHRLRRPCRARRRWPRD
jgi:hypothetical protein